MPFDATLLEPEVERSGFDERLLEPDTKDADEAKAKREAQLRADPRWNVGLVDRIVGAIGNTESFIPQLLKSPEEPGSLEQITGGENAPAVTRFAVGAVRGTEDVVRGLAAPENLPLVPLAAVPLVGPAMGLYFGAQASGSGAGSLYAAQTAGEAGQAAAEIGVGGLIAAKPTMGAIRSRGKIASDVSAIGEAIGRRLRPEQQAPPRPVEQPTPEMPVPPTLRELEIQQAREARLAEQQRPGRPAKPDPAAPPPDAVGVPAVPVAQPMASPTAPIGDQRRIELSRRIGSFEDIPAEMVLPNERVLLESTHVFDEASGTWRYVRPGQSPELVALAPETAKAIAELEAPSSPAEAVTITQPRIESGTPGPALPPDATGSALGKSAALPAGEPMKGVANANQESFATRVAANEPARPVREVAEGKPGESEAVAAPSAEAQVISPTVPGPTPKAGEPSAPVEPRPVETVGETTIEALAKEHGSDWKMDASGMVTPVGFNKQWTPERKAELEAQFKGAGLSIIRTSLSGERMKRGFKVADNDNGRARLENAIVKIEQSSRNEAKAKAALAEEARKQAELDAANPDALKWMDDVFGEDFANPYNKLKLSDYLTGKSKKFEGLASNLWRDGLSKLNATTIEEVKAAYEKRATPKEVTPDAEVPKEGQEVAKPAGVTKAVTEGWSQTQRGRDVLNADLSIENAKDSAVVSAMQSAPSYPKLLAAYHRFKRGLYGKTYDPSVIENKPWEMLDSSAGVMNAKSQTARTLASLEDAVFKESGIPREKGSNKTRGGTGVDWDNVRAEPTKAAPETAAKQPWEMTKQQFKEALGSDLTVRDIELLDAMDNWKKPSGEFGKIYPEAGDIGATRKEWLGLFKRGLMDKAWPGMLSMKARIELSKSRGENPFGPQHKDFIEQALREGKPVPPEVLADYPDLRKQANEKLLEQTGKSVQQGIPKTTAQQLAEVDQSIRELEAKKRIGTDKHRKLLEKYSKLSRQLAKEETGQIKPKAPTEAARPVEPVKLEAKPPEFTGMGGAVPSEFSGGSRVTTSVKNRIVDQEREARGLPPMMAPLRREWAEVATKAEAAIDRDPALPDRLMAEMLEKPRALTDTEHFIALRQRVELKNEYEKAARDVAQDYADMKSAKARGDQAAYEAREAALIDDTARANAWSGELQQWEKAYGKGGAGTETARGLAARKAMMDEDYSLVALEMQKRMDNGGRELTGAERAELVQIADSYTKTVEALSKHIQNLEANEIGAGVDAAIKEAKASASSRPKTEATFDDVVSSTRARVAALLEKGKRNELSPAVSDLVRKIVEDNPKITREQLVDTVHAILKQDIPDITRLETMDAISGRGQFRLPSQDEVDRTVRDLKTQIRLVGHQIDVEARRPLPRTGLQRDKLSDAARREQQILDDLKRRFGVVITDPEAQLASALQARKTYFTHRIADLKFEIARRERVVKQKSLPNTDPELVALRSEYEKVKAEHTELFGKRELTQEQKIKMALASAERSQESWQKRLDAAKKGTYESGKPQTPRITSKEIEAVRAKTEAMKAEVEELKALDAAYQERISAGTIQKSIAEYERRLAAGEFERPSTTKATTPKLEALKAKRDAARKAFAEARDASPLRVAKALEKAKAYGDELQRRINEGDIATKQKSAKAPSAPEIEAQRAENAELQKILAQLRNAAKPKKSPQEIALRALKSRMARQVADLEDRLAKKDFGPRKKPEPIIRDAEANRLQKKLDDIKVKWHDARFKDQMANWTWRQKAWDKFQNLTGLHRAFMTSFEMSAVLRQGKFYMLSHPLKGAKTTYEITKILGQEVAALAKANPIINPIKAVKAASAAGEAARHAIDRQILDRPMYRFYERDKLALTEHGRELSKMEETYRTRWAQKIPGVATSERLYTTFLNRLRADMYDSMAARFERSGEISPEHGRSIARFVNAWTGRGDLPLMERTAGDLANIFFAPRFVASRLQVLSAHPFWKATPEVKKLIATEYGRMLAGMAIYYSLIASWLGLLGDDVEIGANPTGTDWGKIRVRNTRIDPQAGLSQMTVLIARLISGQTMTQKGKILALRDVLTTAGKKRQFGGPGIQSVTGDFLRSKLHPSAQLIATVLTGQDAIGRKLGKNITPADILWQQTPITYQDLLQIMEDQGVPRGTALMLLAFFGEGIQTYEPR